MARRYSRDEKGKWKDDKLHQRKPLVRIPETDVSDLIEQNKFTLIGRVTNPSIQKTRALVDFFLQQWQVVGRITGRDLGPSLFQFNFESEKDLQTILSRAPFHFKNWMFILQRWEPIVSETFPALIPFWVRVHGIPLHYWKYETIDAIGAILGPIEDREVDKARFRVQVNGLKPLIMKLDLQLPSRTVIEVEVEYEKLGKHCFFCKSLTREDSDKHRCPLSRDHTGGIENLGITQQNTLERIEEGRRRQEERRYSRQQHPSRHQHHTTHRGARWTNIRDENRSSETSSKVFGSRIDSGKISEFEENRRRYDDRQLAYRYSTPRESSSLRDSHERFSTSRRTQVYQAKEPENVELPRRVHASPAGEAISTSHRSPVAVLPLEQMRGSMGSRLSDPRTTNLSNDERIPAKERLSVHTRRTSMNDMDMPEIIHSQEKERDPTVTPPVPNALSTFTRPSSSTIFDTGRLGPTERSPIRTLSEDRIHVSLRLGPLQPDENEEDDNVFDLQLQQALTSKAAGKRIAERPKERKRLVRSPTQVATLKRRRTTKVHPSPRRKIMMDAITAGGRTLSKKKKQTASLATIIPARARKEKDFRALPESLP